MADKIYYVQVQWSTTFHSTSILNIKRRAAESVVPHNTNNNEIHVVVARRYSIAVTSDLGITASLLTRLQQV
jgi:hypothetical protein